MQQEKETLGKDANMQRGDDSDGNKEASSRAATNEPQHQQEGIGKRSQEQPQQQAKNSHPQIANTTASTNTGTSRTIYVSNLHPRISEARLQKLFGAYGEICRVHFVQKHSYTFAFVEYQSAQSAKNAIAKLDRQILLRKELVVRYAHDKSDGGTGGRMGVGIGIGGSEVSSSAPTSTRKRSSGSEQEDIRMLKKQKSKVDRKIEAVKRALEESRRKANV
jgi:RNA recognition motif-containing protein